MKEPKEAVQCLEYLTKGDQEGWKMHGWLAEKSMNRHSVKRSKFPKLPEKLRPLFWDYDFYSLTWEYDQDLIIARILAAGDWKTVTWLRERMDDCRLRTWIEQRCGRGLDTRRLRFWALILELPSRQVNVWVASPERRVWEGRTHS